MPYVRVGGSGDKGMLPVSIKQLLEAKQDGPDDNYRVDGRDTNQLTLVALILGVIENSSSVCYTLDDGTGTIDARVWIEQVRHPLSACPSLSH